VIEETEHVVSSGDGYVVVEKDEPIRSRLERQAH